MNTSVNNIYRKRYYNSSSRISVQTNFRFNHISQNNIEKILLINSFSTLKRNWDSYDANPTSKNAITKAISFVLWVSEFDQEVFFTAPSPDGNVVVELKNYDAILEFEFSLDSSDSICATYKGELVTEAELNDTTKIAYLKWLICPNGECPPNL